MNEIPGLLDAIRDMGAASGVVFGLLYLVERLDNRALRKEVRDLLVQTLTVASQSTNAVNEVTKAVAVLGAQLMQSMLRRDP